MQLYEIMFGIPVLLGVVLVLGAATGLAGLDAGAGADLDDIDDAGGGVMSALGLGRVPLMVVAMLLLLTFGGVGLAVHPLLASFMSSNTAVCFSWAVASLSSLLITRLSSRAIARVLPSVETYASTKRELVGQAGTVVARLTRDEVMLRVLDRGGAELRVKGLVRGSPARVGETLVVTYYEPTRDAYYLDRLSLTE